MRNANILFMAATVIAAPCLAMAEASTADAKTYVQEVATQVITVLQKYKNDFDQRRAAFSKLFMQYADVPRMAAFAAGPLWQPATPAQRSAYTEAFANYMASSYARRFESYSGEKVTMGRVIDGGRKGLVVETRIERAGQAPVALDWQLRTNADGSLKVNDVLAEQISMLLTHKTEFMAIVATNPKATLDDLTQMLQRRVQS